MPLEFLLSYALIMDGVHLALIRVCVGEFEHAWTAAFHVLCLK